MIHSPVLIIGCPRSGTTLLFNLLSEAPELWSMGFESGAIIEQWHHPRNKGWASGELAAGDLTAESRAGILAALEAQAAPGRFWRQMNDFRSGLRRNSLWREVKRRGQTREAGAGTSSDLPQHGVGLIKGFVRWRNRLGRPRREEPIRLVEKTPENCLRLPFLLALLPDARIIYLVRDGRSNVSSLMEGWRHPHLFHGYRPPYPLNIPGNGQPEAWAFTLIPGWRELAAAPLEEVCAWQWVRCNRAVLNHQHETAGRVPYLTVRYEELIERPEPLLRQIADFASIDYDRSLARYAGRLPQINVVSTPDQEKWRRHNREAIERVTPIIRPMMDELAYDAH